VSDNVEYVCSECDSSLVSAQSDENPHVTEWRCPTHGVRGFFMHMGRLCAECYELIEPEESAVPSCVLDGEPLVHPECAG
jgi:DNA-directed RNA polymerase subunit RPC12/RpoP